MVAGRVGPVRGRRRRLLVAFALGIAAVALLVAWDQSRQPTGGTDWQLLGWRRVIGTPRSVRVISTPEDLAGAWYDFRIAGDAGSVDLARSAVIWFSNLGSQACPSRLDDVSIDVPRRKVTAHFSRGLTVGCDAKAIPDSFLVLIDRQRLPPTPYRIEMQDPFAPAGVPFGVDVP